MKIALVFPELPPALDGIGDYTARLGKAFYDLCDGAVEVSIHTAAQQYDTIEGVEIISSFSIDSSGGVDGLKESLVQVEPDWIVLQYNPFSYGKRGLNLSLPHVVHSTKKLLPSTKLALMVHEPFVPVDTFKNLVMTTWQRWQLWQLGQAADLLYFSIEPWATKFSKWFKNKRVQHLPVGSNMPLVPSDRVKTREHLSIKPNEFVMGIFGTLHPSRLMHFINRAVEVLQQKSIESTILYIGPHGEKARQALEGVRIIDAGKLSPEEVSHHFQAMDLYVAPFRKGVSARRGSFLVGIQHGIATVSTHGIHTDTFIKRAHEAAFLLASDQDMEAFANQVERLAQDEEERQKVAAEGQKFFNAHFSWSRIAERQYRDMESFENAHEKSDSPPVLHKR